VIPFHYKGLDAGVGIAPTDIQVMSMASLSVAPYLLVYYHNTLFINFNNINHREVTISFLFYVPTS
jgi:hypothetical protein